MKPSPEGSRGRTGSGSQPLTPDPDLTGVRSPVSGDDKKVGMNTNHREDGVGVGGIFKGGKGADSDQGVHFYSQAALRIQPHHL